MNLLQLQDLSKLLRYYILLSTTFSQSGHPTSSLSAVELMATLLFGGNFRFDLDRPELETNDRLIFSKGHASPLFYALWVAAGKLSEDELKELRTFESVLEGHPSMRFAYTEAATGSLGQGLSIGVGAALNAKYLDKLDYRTIVLLGDSEMAEGSNWEAIQLAAHYQLHNLIGIIDVNGLGQRGETMYGHNVDAYAERINSFGWKTIVIDGHNIQEIHEAYQVALKSHGRPTMIIAKTLKGKGISLWEGKEGWHSKTLTKDQFAEAVKELGELPPERGDFRKLIVQPTSQSHVAASQPVSTDSVVTYAPDEKVATKKAYGDALVELGKEFEQLVVLDAEVSNSTHAEQFQQEFPERFFEMFIAEQNMVGVAVGLASRGKLPCVSTFGAFLTRAYDQIRMARYSFANITFAGSYAGVSLGMDGTSQMGLEDIAMFRAVLNSLVIYPSDAVSAKKLTRLLQTHTGIKYVRLTREPTSILYDQDEHFEIGGSKVLRTSDDDQVTVVAAGITLHEALKAYDKLQREGITIRVIDLYSIKPVDHLTLKKAATETQALLVVEDHYAEGGMGEAVMQALATQLVPIHHLAVRKMPRSGQPQELLEYEEISAGAIVEKVREMISYE